MQVWIALFRGINVGGHNRLPMPALRDLLQGLGFSGVQTYIQSGNAVLLGPPDDPVVLGQKITNAIEQHFGFAPKVWMIKSNAFDQIITENPYKDSVNEHKNIHVYFLAKPAENPDLAKLETLRAKDEMVCLKDSAFYLLAPSGIGRSKLAGNIDIILGVQTTARNWRSVLKIKAMADAITAA